MACASLAIGSVKTCDAPFAFAASRCSMKLFAHDVCSCGVMSPQVAGLPGAKRYYEGLFVICPLKLKREFYHSI